MSRNGQVTLEYFILFAVVALVTMFGVARFHGDIRDGLQHFFGKASNAIAN